MDGILKVLEKSVLKIIDEKGNEIKYDTLEIKPYKHKYSSAGVESLTLFVDSKSITGKERTRLTKIEYKCSCGKINRICLCKFLKKEKLSCQSCREDDEKIKWHKLYFELKRKGIDRGHKERPHTTYNFDAESEEFRCDYFRRNLTKDEFNIAIRFIYSIDGVETAGKDVQFIIAEPVHNAKRYAQYVLIDGVKHRLSDICLKCPMCGDIFHITRQLKERIVSHNFDCRKCFLNNKTFAIKKLDNLTYQGSLELNFIKECRSRCIKIENGTKIPYIFDGRKHIYTVDFYLPEYGLNVEIKDNHIWHRKQVASGKWLAKENAAKRYSLENNEKFYLLFKNDIESFFKNLERDSLTSIE